MYPFLRSWAADLAAASQKWRSLASIAAMAIRTVKIHCCGPVCSSAEGAACRSSAGGLPGVGAVAACGLISLWTSLCRPAADRQASSTPYGTGHIQVIRCIVWSTCLVAVLVTSWLWAVARYLMASCSRRITPAATAVRGAGAVLSLPGCILGIFCRVGGHSDT